jgi:integrase/recombinase XerD
MIDSWDLHLRAEKKSAKTIHTYLEATQWLAVGYLIPAWLTDWDEVRAKQVQEWTITLLGRYSDAYANNQFHAAWLCRSGRVVPSRAGRPARARW